MAWIQMRDFWTFRPTEVQENKKYLFECRDSKSDTGSSLLVHVAASHSGIVNGNRRFYRPDRMQESIHTWLPLKAADGTMLRTARPVLIGHDEKGDVLGRVLEATYVDDSWKHAGDFPVIKDFLFYQRDGRKRHDLFKSVDWVVDNLLELDEYTGLGHTELGIRITNPEAIRKVLADEYLTVSVGFKTDQAICSLCHTNWATDGKCGHKLGEVDEGKHMFLIAGAMDNQELSFINFAADPFATVLDKKILTDSLEKMFFLGLPINQQDSFTADGLQLTDGLIFEADMVAAEEPMTATTDIKTTLDLAAMGIELKSKDLTRVKAMEIKDSLASFTPDTEDGKSQKRSLVSTVNAKIRAKKWDKVQDAAPSATDDQVAAELATMMEDAKKPKPAFLAAKEHKEDDETCECAECAKKKAKKEKDSAPSFNLFANWTPDSDEDRTYFEDGSGIAAELGIELGTSKLADATIDALSADTFCGPNRTFPVPDAIHAAAVRKVVTAAKMTDALRATILANVAIKEKGFPAPAAAVAPVVVKDSAPAADTVRAARIDKFLDSVVMTDAQAKEVAPEVRTAMVATLKSLDSSYDALPNSDVKWRLRWAIRAMLTDWDADDDVKYALEALAGNKDHVVLTRSEIDEKDEALNGLMAEKDALAIEVTSLKDSRAVMLSAAKETLAQQIVMSNVYKAQDGYKDLTPDQIQEKVATLSKRHITSLRDSVSDILSGLKWTDSQPSAAKAPDATAVDDATQISETAPVVKMTDAAQAEADAAHELVLTKLRYMSPLEQTRFLGQMAFEAAKTQITK